LIIMNRRAFLATTATAVGVAGAGLAVAGTAHGETVTSPPTGPVSWPVGTRPESITKAWEGKFYLSIQGTPDNADGEIHIFDPDTGAVTPFITADKKLLDNRYLSMRFSEHTVGSPALRWDGPGLAGGCRAGLTLHSHQPRRRGLTVGSTSSHRATPGGVVFGRESGEVACGVEVSVQDQTARLTLVLALRQGQLGFHRAAARAGLRGRIPAVGDDQPPAVPRGLVRQLPP
jgi:hypothetical protein